MCLAVVSSLGGGGGGDVSLGAVTSPGHAEIVPRATASSSAGG